ncbi:MAG: hypothetical protein Q4D21_01575 [Phascolarctobacterium sp.]|nr:hypothetical protein [Phascolarctobacterium sp.]
MNQEQSMQAFKGRITKLGLFFTTLAVVANFVPAVYVSTATGIFPSAGQILQIWIAAAAAFGAGYFVQPIAYFPMLGLAGTFLCWVVGSVGDLRLPCAVMAQKITNAEQGTPKAELVGTIAICCSVVVSMAMITFFTVAGNAVMPYCPKIVLKALGFVLPGVIGAVYADFCSKDFKLGIICFLICLAGKFIFPKIGVPSALIMLVNIICCILAARAIFMTMKKA